MNNAVILYFFKEINRFEANRKKHYGQDNQEYGSHRDRIKLNGSSVDLLAVFCF